MEKHAKKRILVVSHVKHQTPVFFFHITKAVNWVLQFLKLYKNNFSFEEYIFFASDEVFYCWVAGEWVQNMGTNILIFKFIVLRLATYSVSGTILE